MVTKHHRDTDRIDPKGPALETLELGSPDLEPLGLGFDPYELPFGDPRFDALPPREPKKWEGSIPPHLETMEPGPFLAVWLSGINVATLKGSDRVAVLRSHQRLVNHFQAEMYRDMLAIGDLIAEEEEIDDALDAPLAAEAEVQAALMWSRQRTQTELATAHELRERLPRVLEAVLLGDIDIARAKAILEGTSSLALDVAAGVADRALGLAGQATVGQLRSRLRLWVLEAEPEAAERHLEAAIAERRIVTEATLDGSANLMGLDLPPERAAAISKRIESFARRARQGGDKRTADQLRADVFMDLLQGRSPSRIMDDSRRTSNGSKSTGREQTDGPSQTSEHSQTDIRSQVEIRVDLTTLMGLDERAAEIPGFGPVIGEIARKVALDHNGSWTYTVTDPATGHPASTGTVRRRPTAAQARSVRARQPVCVFPGCRMPASQSDLDHRKPWGSGGATDEANLYPLCRYHHRIKSTAGWTYDDDPDGAILWRSRFGRIYRRRPPP